MKLQLYPRDFSNSFSIDWILFSDVDDFCEVFQEPESHDFTLRHPLGNINLFVPMVNYGASFIDIDEDCIIDLLERQDAWEHPLWRRIYRLLSHGSACLLVKLAHWSSPIATGLLFGAHDPAPDLTERMRRDYILIPCPTFELFMSAIRSAWNIEFEVATASRSRTGWVDHKTRDEVAAQDFKNYVTGKVTRNNHSWGEKKIRTSTGANSFLESYGLWVDWRDDDESVIDSIADRFTNREIVKIRTSLGVSISHSSDAKKVVNISGVHDRYDTIRALNFIINPHHEIRVVKSSKKGDTHCFLVGPSWLWIYLEENFPQQISKRIASISPEDSFS